MNHVQVGPHHDCFIHAQLVASTPAGCIVEAFTDPARDPLQAELFENPPGIAGGWVTPNVAPRLGLTLSGAPLTKLVHRALGPLPPPPAPPPPQRLLRHLRQRPAH